MPFIIEAVQVTVVLRADNRCSNHPLYSANNPCFAVSWWVIQDFLQFAPLAKTLLGQSTVCPLYCRGVSWWEKIGRVILCNTKQSYICHFPSTWCSLARLHYVKVLCPRHPNGLVSNSYTFPILALKTHDRISNLVTASGYYYSLRRSAFLINRGL